MVKRFPGAVTAYVFAIFATAAAVALRWGLDPWLQNDLPLVTLFAANAAAAYVGGIGPAVLATALGYVACDYLFMEPRGTLGLHGLPELIGLIAYLGSSAIIVGFAQAMRVARQRARERWEFLRITLASIGDAVITTDTKCRVTSVNPVAETLTGWRQEDALGQPLGTVFKIVNEQTGAPVENPVMRAVRDGVVVGLANHTVLIARDGTERPIDDSAAPILDEGGEVAGSVLVFRDVSERRRADQAVRRSERELSDFFDTAAIGLHWAGPDGIITRVNQHELDLLGYSREEYVGHHVGEFHADAPVIEEILRRLESGEAIEDMPARLRRKDGSIKHVLISSSVLWQDGKLIHTRCFTRDVSDSAKAARADAVLAAIVESSDDAIISKTLDGVVSSWNKSAERLFGYTAEEMIGRPIAILAPPDRVDEMPNILAKLRAGQRIEHFDTERMHKDGSRVSVSLSISPVRDATGRIIGASKIARDIRDRKRIEEAKEQLLAAERAARVEAERANRLKEEFLATISHELRTPLSAILGWARLLLTHDHSDAERQKGLQVIERNARVQTQIIEDLLDMSRIISGKVRLDVQRVSLVPVIDAALETVRPASLAKDIRLQSMLDPSAGQVLGDSTRLQQVVGNLLSNAVKFTPKGGRVQISLQRVNSHIEVVVSDSGQGIKAEFLPYVFDRFRQGDPSTTRVHGGLGIGLAIVKSLVELHGGTVSVESEGEGRGASFRVELPFAIVNTPIDVDRIHPRASPATTGRQEDPSLSGLTILVVDDEPDARDLIRRLLEERGASVVTAESASNALSLFEQSRPDVLVSDIGMPHQDGYELIDQIRRFEKRARIHKVPALALTAFARWEDRTRALLAGYEMHVAKPVEPSELVASIASLARRQS